MLTIVNPCVIAFSGAPHTALARVKLLRKSCSMGQTLLLANISCQRSEMMRVSHATILSSKSSAKLFGMSAKMVPMMLLHNAILATSISKEMVWRKTANGRGSISSSPQVKAGNAAAQCCLGFLYNLGHSVQQDYVQARHYYQLAADQGHKIAQNNLGGYYYHGLGGPQDYEKAEHYFKLSADQGNALAQFFLGYLYHEGPFVKQDYGMAMKYYELAADQGLAEAQNNLGFLCTTGIGVQQDYDKARHFYELAADQGHATAQDNLKSLNKRLQDAP